jgi:outer membrane protein TolC
MALSDQKNVFRTCLVILALTALIFFALAGEALAGPPELEQLISEAIVKNQGLQAIQARAAALETEIPSAGTLDDPMLGLALANVPTDTFDFNHEPMTQKQIFVSQKFPWFGKRGLKGEVAGLKAEKEAAVLEKQKLELTRKVSELFYRLWYVDRALDNNRRLKEMLTQVLEVTRTGYTSGRAQEKDLIQAQLEISRLEDKRIVLETERRTVDKDLNGLLNRAVFHSIKPPDQLAKPEPAMEIEALKQALQENNPQIRIKRIELKMAERETALADKNFWPDSEWRLTYGQRDEIKGQQMADFLSASVMFNVPLWQGRKQTPIRDAKQEMTASARLALNNLLSALPYELEAVSGELADLTRNYRFYKETMINQAADLARSSMYSYQVGKLAFDIMIRAQIRQLDVELQADKYLQMIYMKQAMLDELTGQPVTTLTGEKAE